MATQDNVSLARAMYDSFSEHNLDRAVSYVASNVAWTDVSIGQTYNGPEGFRQMIRGLSTAFPDAKVNISNLVGAGDWVIAEYQCRGTHTGPFETPSGTVPPTRRPMDLRVCEILRFRDGKVVEGRTYLDRATVMSQLGLMPAESVSRSEHREERPFA